MQCSRAIIAHNIKSKFDYIMSCCSSTDTSYFVFNGKIFMLGITDCVIDILQESCQAVFESLPFTSESQPAKDSSSGDYVTSIKQFPLGPKFACPLQSDSVQISTNLIVIRPVQSSILSYWTTIIIQRLMLIIK